MLTLTIEEAVTTSIPLMARHQPRLTFLNIDLVIECQVASILHGTQVVLWGKPLSSSCASRVGNDLAVEMIQLS